MRGHKDVGCVTGAVGVGGSRSKVRRVRVIDFGTESPLQECFPLYTARANYDVPEPRNCQIIDCIVEQPSPNNVRETSVLAFGAGEVDDYGLRNPSLRGVMAYHRSCLMRRNRIDCDYAIDPRQIKEIRFTGTSATARTFQAHNRKVGDWIIVSGALVADSLDNPYNGSFQINVVASAHEFSYAMQANPGAEPTGTMWLNRFSSHYVRVTSVSQSGNGPWTITLTTPTPHFRVPGQNILVQNMRRQSNPDVLSPISAPGVFHRLVDVPAPTVLRFIMTTDPGNDFYPAFATIGVSFQAWGINGGVAALGERNRVFGARMEHQGHGRIEELFTTRS